MALRAGYYGLKRRFKDKLESIALSWNETIGSLFPRDEESVLGALNLFDKSKVSGIDATITQTTDGFRAQVSSHTWGSARYDIDTPRKNTDFVVSCNANVATAGNFMKLQVYGSSDGSDYSHSIAVTDIYTATKELSLKFNSGDYNYLRFTFYLTNGTAASADVTFEKPQLELGTVQHSYVPYAMTNKALTDALSVKVITHSDAVTGDNLSVTFTEYISGNMEQIVGTVTSSEDKAASAQSGVSLGTVLAHVPIASVVVGDINSSLSASDRKPISTITITNTGRLQVDGQMVASRSYSFSIDYIFSSGSLTQINRSVDTREIASAPEEIVKDEIEEPVVEKKTTTRKKSTAKADTKEEV